jgi:hypothetical protein
MPFSGGYSETTLETDKYRLWSGLREWEIYQWLVPGAQMATRHYQTKGQPPANVEPFRQWCARNRITPLVPSNDFKEFTK